MWCVCACGGQEIIVIAAIKTTAAPAAALCTLRSARCSLQVIQGMLPCSHVPAPARVLRLCTSHQTSATCLHTCYTPWHTGASA